MTIYLIKLFEAIYDYKICHDQKINKTIWIKRIKSDFDRMVIFFLLKLKLD